MNESITSVAKREQRIADAPAAVYVLTADEILRAGHTSVAEALRMVPGLSVAQLGSHEWVVTARGFAAQWAGKLLVLIDGRTVYDPFFSGVFWSRRNPPLEDIERIEVIRGPGAALWGANAVNGVINIITKSAADTQGGLATASWGESGSDGALRYGGQAGNAYYRAYVNYEDHDSFVNRDGSDAGDSWRMWRGGFRTDWRTSSADQLTVQGELFGAGQNAIATVVSLTPPYRREFPFEEDVSGGHILGRWQHDAEDGSQWSLQTYYDNNEGREPMLSVARETFDIEFQHQLAAGTRQAIVYGAGYRFTHADYEDSFLLSYPVEHDSADLFNVFVQDEIALVKDKLALTVGSKFEYNKFTDLEVQPSARLLWTPDSQHSVWGSVSRAVRTPNFGDTRLRINYAVFDADGPGPRLPTVLSVLPNDDLVSETVVAYELGYRSRPHRSFFVDVATFVNVYKDILVADSSGAMFETSPPPHLAITSRMSNHMHGDTYGVELAPTWQVNDRWQVAAGYTWLQMNLHSTAADQVGEEEEGDSPRHQIHLRSFLNVTGNLTLDAAIYYVDSLPNQGIESYVRGDARLGWRPTDGLELSVGGTNLLDSRHAEFRSYQTRATEQQRNVHVKVRWQF